MHSATIIPLHRNNLKQLRKARGWTQDEAAEKFGMSRGGYIKMEQGERTVLQPRLERACSLYGCTADEVVGREQIRARSPDLSHAKAAAIVCMFRTRPFATDDERWSWLESEIALAIRASAGVA